MMAATQPRLTDGRWTVTEHPQPSGGLNPDWLDGWPTDDPAGDDPQPGYTPDMSRNELIQRGWTESDIRKRLGDPVAHVLIHGNPYADSYALYCGQKIAEAEQDPDFREKMTRRRAIRLERGYYRYLDHSRTPTRLRPPDPDYPHISWSPADDPWAVENQLPDPDF